MFASSMAETTVVAAQKPPNAVQKLFYRVRIFFKAHWPETVCVVLAVLVGAAIGLGISFSALAPPKPAWHLTKLGPWSEWSVCDRSCGPGRHHRTRLFDTDRQPESGKCPKDVCLSGKEERDCNLRPCCLVGNSSHEFTHCYHVVDIYKTWGSAREFAGRRGPDINSYGETRPNAPGTYVDGELVSVHSHRENAFVLALAEQWYKRHSGNDPDPEFWIGLRCGEGPASCYWSDGSTLDFLQLPIDQKWPKTTHCAYIDVSQPDYWRFDNCETSRRFMSKSFNQSSKLCGEEKGDGYKPDTCYELIQHDKSWEEARDAEGSFLATVQSFEELQHLIDRVLKDSDDSIIWLGLTCDRSWPDQCYWVDGSSFSYRVDESALFNKLDFERKTTCLAMEVKGGDLYSWFFDDCEKTHAYLKEELPRCDKVGYDEKHWSDWSSWCYKNHSCKRDSGDRFRIQFTRFPGVPGCPDGPPNGPTNPLIETQKCTPACYGEDSRRPPPPKTVTKMEDSCAWFKVESQPVPAVQIIRGSEDYEMLRRLFKSFAENYTLDLGVDVINKLDRSVTVRERWRERSESYIGLPFEQSHSFNAKSSFCRAIDSNVDYPCMYVRDDMPAYKKYDPNNIALLGIRGRCLISLRADKDWEAARRECEESFNSPLYKVEADEQGDYEFRFLEHGESGWPYLGLRRRSDSQEWFWAREDGREEPAKEIHWKDRRWTSDNQRQCAVLNLDASEPSASVHAQKCNDKTRSICEWQQTSETEEIIWVRPSFECVGAGRQLTEVDDWLNCRCSAFESDQAVNLTKNCYWVHRGKTTYKDNLVSQATDNVLSAEQMMDLVTIKDDAEQVEVESEIKAYYRANLMESGKDPACDSVPTEKPRMSVGDTCYVLDDRPHTHTQALMACNEAPGGRLAYLDNQLRSDLYSHWSELKLGKKTFWTGLHLGSDGEWQWGEAAATNIPWAVGHPETNKPLSLPFHCALAHHTDSFKLTAADCHRPHPFICQFNQELRDIKYIVDVTWSSSPTVNISLEVAGVKGMFNVDLVMPDVEWKNFPRKTSAVIFEKDIGEVTTVRATANAGHVLLPMVEVTVPVRNIKYYFNIETILILKDKLSRETDGQDPCKGWEEEDNVLKRVRDTCYMFVNKTVKQSEALTSCENLRGRLVHVPNDIVLYDLYWAFADEEGTFMPVWTGHIDGGRWAGGYLSRRLPVSSPQLLDPTKAGSILEDPFKPLVQVKDSELATKTARFICEKSLDDPCASVSGDRKAVYGSSCLASFTANKKLTMMEAQSLCQQTGPGGHLVSQSVVSDKATRLMAHRHHDAGDGWRDKPFLSVMGEIPKYLGLKSSDAFWVDVSEGVAAAQSWDEDGKNYIRLAATEAYYLYYSSISEGPAILDYVNRPKCVTRTSRAEEDWKEVLCDTRETETVVCQYEPKAVKHTVTLALGSTSLLPKSLKLGLSFHHDEKFEEKHSSSPKTLFFYTPPQATIDWAWSPSSEKKIEFLYPDTLSKQYLRLSLATTSANKFHVAALVHSITLEVEGARYQYYPQGGTTDWPVVFTDRTDEPKKFALVTSSSKPPVASGASLSSTNANPCERAAIDWTTASTETDCFVFVNQSLPFYDASDYCTRHGGALASIDSDGRYQLMQKWKTKEDSKVYSPAFVGARKEDSGWVWTRERGQVPADAWAADEPRDPQVNGAGACSVAFMKNELQVRDEDCSGHKYHGLICQYGPMDAKHYLIGLYCDEPGNAFSCRWNDGATPLLFHYFESWRRRSLPQSYKCAAVRQDFTTGDFKWVPWNCNQPILPVLEVRRYCEKWKCKPNTKCPENGFAAMVQKDGWGSCRLYPADGALRGECEKLDVYFMDGEVEVAINPDTWTNQFVSGCYFAIGAVKRKGKHYVPDYDLKKDDWRKVRTGTFWHTQLKSRAERNIGRKTYLAHLSSLLEYKWIAKYIDLPSRMLPHYVGAKCYNNKVNGDRKNESTWLDCVWLHDNSSEGLHFHSPAWFAFPTRPWRSLITWMGIVDCDPVNLKHYMNDINEEGNTAAELYGNLGESVYCVALWPGVIPAKLVTVRCDDASLPALFQTDKFFYGAQKERLKSSATKMARYREDVPDDDHLDRPVVHYMVNADDGTK